MVDGRIPKDLLCGEPKAGETEVAPSVSDIVCKKDLKALDIDVSS